MIAYRFTVRGPCVQRFSDVPLPETVPAADSRLENPFLAGKSGFPVTEEQETGTCGRGAGAREDMNAVIARIPNGLRWALFLPASIGAGFLVAGLIHLPFADDAGASRVPAAYAAAFLSGLAYVWAALHVAHAVAPSHQRIVVTVLGILILGDMSVVHLILNTNLIQQIAVPESGDSGLSLILGALRTDDYSGLPNGGFVKLGGILAGCYIAWWKYVRDKRP